MNGDDCRTFSLFAVSAYLILGYRDQILPHCLIKTRILTFVSDNSGGVFATPGPTSSSRIKNYMIPLFSKRPKRKSPFVFGYAWIW